jgi:hypothetical protein
LISADAAGADAALMRDVYPPFAPAADDAEAGAMTGKSQQCQQRPAAWHWGHV